MEMPNLISKVRRDQQIRRLARRLQALAPHLDRQEYAPLVRSFARITLLIERAYLTLRDRELLSDEGELRPSLDIFRRLTSTQAQLARELGLSPTTGHSLAKSVELLDLAAMRKEPEGEQFDEEDDDC
jgi:hypothetical protein